MGDSPGDETGHSLNPTKAHPAPAALFVLKRVSDRIEGMILTLGVDVFIVTLTSLQRRNRPDCIAAAREEHDARL